MYKNKNGFFVNLLRNIFKFFEYIYMYILDIVVYLVFIYIYFFLISNDFINCFEEIFV